MKIGLALIGIVAGILLTVAMVFTAGWTRPPVTATQVGFRGVAMEQLRSPAAQAALKLANVMPDPIDKASADGPRATAEYKNVQVLQDLSVDQFNRVMLSITEWVAPEQGCTYCHNPENLAEDNLYTKIVSRRMLQMTRHINTDWKAHVAETGVTCYTCHRGKPQPVEQWSANPGGPRAGGFAAVNSGMGHPTKANGSTTMAIDPWTPYLQGQDPIRVISTTALPVSGKPGASVQTAESTYSLMISMSAALGVNCTFCHNSRSFSQWQQSPPQRGVAWHGIQMTRDLNMAYLDPLKTTFPADRLGPTGDSPKVNCATCHQGVNKPLYGQSLAKDYPELAVPAKR